MFSKKSKGFCFLVLVIIFLLLIYFINMEEFMSKNYKDVQKIDELFYREKLSCFGRYAIILPNEAKLIWGEVSFPSKIGVHSFDKRPIERYVDEDISRIKLENDTAEIFFSGEAYSGLGWKINYYEDKFAKRDDALYSKDYVRRGEYLFLLSSSKGEKEPIEAFFDRQGLMVKSLMAREIDNVPHSPGYCIDRGFIINDSYDNQEMVAVGIRFPSYEDVIFSISSNKDAYADYSSAEFDGRLRGELSLLARIKQAKNDQGPAYPDRAVLREGMRTVQHWKGEESLIRRGDGTHDFEWAFVGNPKDVANPSEFSVQMFTKVAYNMIGSAEKASLTDEEAVALWDKLLSGLKFRVKVPGAPEGSYYSLPSVRTESGAAP
jgi:hypothetical protein